MQAQRFVERDVFLTPRLWGVGSTAPYGHRGDFRMLDEIIAAHGGEARFARDAYLALDKPERDTVIAFLRSLDDRGAVMSSVAARDRVRREASLTIARPSASRLVWRLARSLRPHAGAPQKPLGDVPSCPRGGGGGGDRNRLRRPVGVLRRRRRRGVRLRRLGLPRGVPRRRQEPRQAVRQQVDDAAGRSKFEEKPLDIGADPKLLDNVIGAYPLDIDGDGHMDLFVLRVGENLLLKGGPDCTFTLANKEWGFDGDPGWTTSFAAEWEKGQKFPTLAIGHYVDRDAPGSPWGTCEENSLFRPQPGDKPGLFRADAARARLLRAVDAVHRLEPLGHAVAARLQRSPILSRRRGADVADRARQAAEALLAAPTAGGTSRSSAWASPRATSTAPAIPNTR